jgi:hypothetical protein
MNPKTHPIELIKGRVYTQFEHFKNQDYVNLN